MIRARSLAVFGYCLIATSAHSEPIRSFLAPGQALSGAQDQELTAFRLRFVMQHDCNLVAYHDNRAVWATNTHGKGSGCVAIMQGDGNLVLLRGGDGKVLWASGTHRNPGAWLMAQTDGNVVIYRPGDAKAGRALWATNTVIKRPARSATGAAGSPFAGCAFAETKMKCVVAVQMCKAVWSCGADYGSMTPIQKSESWRPCGVCFKL